MLLGITLNLLEDVVEGSWHDTFLDGVVGDTSDSECFTCTGLTVGEDGSIVTSDDVLTNGVCSFCKDSLLLRTKIRI